MLLLDGPPGNELASISERSGGCLWSLYWPPIESATARCWEKIGVLVCVNCWFVPLADEEAFPPRLVAVREASTDGLSLPPPVVAVAFLDVS